MPDRVRLFLFAGASEPDDPLDPLTPLLAVFSASAEIIDARHHGHVPERTAARLFRPGVDLAVHDLTDVNAPHISRTFALRSSGAVLVSAERRHERAPVSSVGRWRTPTPPDSLSPAGAVIVAMDAKAPGVRARVSRSVTMPVSDKRYGLVFAGETAALYAALLAMRKGGWTDTATLLVGDEASLEVVLRYAALLDLRERVSVLHAKSRKDRAMIASRAERVLDLNPFAWPGLTDLMLAGKAAGALARRTEGALCELPDLIARAVSETDRDRYAGVSPDQAARGVLEAAEAARQNFATIRKAS